MGKHGLSASEPAQGMQEASRKFLEFRPFGEPVEQKCLSTIGKTHVQEPAFSISLNTLNASVSEV